MASNGGPGPGLRDANREQRTLHLNQTSERYAVDLKRFLDKLLHEYFDRMATPHDGTAIALDTGAKIVTVQVDPEPAADGAGAGVTSQVRACRYGRPKWSRKEIVGKRVRVWENRGGPNQGVWVVENVLE